MTLGQIDLRSLLLLLAVLLFPPVSAPAAELDRDYQFGDDPSENGSPGDPVGVPIDAFILTYDSVGTLGAGDLKTSRWRAIPPTSARRPARWPAVEKWGFALTATIICLVKISMDRPTRGHRSATSTTTAIPLPGRTTIVAL